VETPFLAVGAAQMQGVPSASLRAGSSTALADSLRSSTCSAQDDRAEEGKRLALTSNDEFFHGD